MFSSRVTEELTAVVVTGYFFLPSAGKIRYSANRAKIGGLTESTREELQRSFDRSAYHNKHTCSVLIEFT
jgi:hypothetical protein